MANFTASTNQKKTLSFFDVLRFAAGYWVRQPKKLIAILLLILTAALFEVYLPSALSSFLSAIRNHGNQSEILHRLEIFIGVYLAQAILFSSSYLSTILSRQPFLNH